MTECEHDVAYNQQRKGLIHKTSQEQSQRVEGESDEISYFDSFFIEEVIDGDVDEWEDEEGEDGGEVDDPLWFVVDDWEGVCDGYDEIIKESVEYHGRGRYGEYNPPIFFFFEFSTNDHYTFFEMLRRILHQINQIMSIPIIKWR